MPTPATQPSPLAMLALAARGAFVVGLLAVTVLSLAPAPALPSVDLSDKLQHALAYAFLATTGCFGFGLTRSRARLVVVVALSLFGGLIELTQPVLAARTASVADALANEIGVALGWMLARTTGAVLQRPWSA
jgi:VanZ family protein